MLPHYPEIELDLPSQALVSECTDIGMDAIIRQIAHRPPVLFHYTGHQGFNGIVTSTSVRATHMSYMNDSEEYVHAIKLFKEELQSLNRVSTGTFKQFTDYFDQRVYLDKPRNYPPYFIACFSALGDSLSQWRAYGQHGQRFAIGFDSTGLGACASFRALLAPVIYDDEVKRQVLRQMLQQLQQNFSKIEIANAALEKDVLYKRISEYFILKSVPIAPFFKHHAFEEEQEWRISYHPERVEEIGFAETPTMLRPYIELPLYDITNLQELANRLRPSQKPKKLPILNVRVGPSSNVDLAESAAHVLLLNNGYEGVEVLVSETPFRTL